MMAGLFRTLSGHVREQRLEWARSNPSRLKYEPGPLRRVFESASESPIRWVGWACLLFLIGTLVSAFHFAPPYPGAFDFQPADESFDP